MKQTFKMAQFETQQMYRYYYDIEIYGNTQQGYHRGRFWLMERLQDQQVWRAKFKFNPTLDKIDNTFRNLSHSGITYHEDHISFICNQPRDFIPGYINDDNAVYRDFADVINTLKQMINHLEEQKEQVIATPSTFEPRKRRKIKA